MKSLRVRMGSLVLSAMVLSGSVGIELAQAKSEVSGDYLGVSSPMTRSAVASKWGNPYSATADCVEKAGYDVNHAVSTDSTLKDGMAADRSSFSCGDLTGQNTFQMVASVSTSKDPAPEDVGEEYGGNSSSRRSGGGRAKGAH